MRFTAIQHIVYSLDDSGFFLTADASIDGNALANAIDSNGKINTFFAAPQKDDSSEAEYLRVAKGSEAMA